MDMVPFLRKMVESKASDLFLTIDMPPSVRINGEFFALSKQPFTQEEVKQAVESLMNESQLKEFSQTNESNFAFDLDDIGRFRVSAFIQRSKPGCVVRHIQTKIPTIDELNLPPAVKSISLLKKGLVIIVGATGMGKSTTQAAMIGHRNMSATGHILTIDDPIEYLHTHKKCIVTQREVGVDTESYEIALKNAMRQAPDVIQIGEIRDAATMKFAINFAETGHLCMATFHANNVNQALERIIHFYPKHARDQVWMDLSLNLRAILAQRLVKKIGGKSRVAAVEILVNTPIMSDCIRKGEIHNLKEYMGRKNNQGMQTFDQALLNLFVQGQITEQEALANADSANNLRLMIKMNDTQPSQKTDNNQSFSLENDEEQ